jgi:MFS family permease
MMRSTLFPLGATLAVQMLVAMAVVTVPVLAPVAAIDAGVSAGYVGLFVAIVYGGSMVSSLVSGNLIQKYGPIRVSQFCLVSCAAGLACTVGATPALLVAGALLLGFGYGPVTPASSHLLSKTTPPHMMSLIFSLKQTGVPLGGVLAGAVVPSLVLLWGWRAAALVVGLVCVATAALAQPIRQSLDAERAGGARIRFAGALDPLRFTIAHPAIRRLAFCSFFFASMQVCLTTYLVTYLTRDIGYSLLQAGLMLSVAQGGGVVARVAWGAIADYTGRPLKVLGLIACAMALCALAAALLTSGWSLIAVAVVCAAFGATAIGWNGVYLAQVAKEAPQGRAALATGGALFFTFFGVLIGPALFAFLVEGGISYPAAFLLLAAPALACGLWLLWQEAGMRSAAALARSREAQ